MNGLSLIVEQSGLEFSFVGIRYRRRISRRQVPNRLNVVRMAFMTIEVSWRRFLYHRAERRYHGKESQTGEEDLFAHVDSLASKLRTDGIWHFAS
jgi:hypothetical protein